MSAGDKPMRTEVEYLRDALSEIAHFRENQPFKIEQQASLLREKARIVLADSLTREAIRTNDAECLAEIAALWSDYCAGELTMDALAQEIGEALAARPAVEAERHDG